MKRKLLLLALLILPLCSFAMEEKITETDHWSELPAEVQEQILSFIVNTKQITSLSVLSRPEYNKKIFVNALNQWAILKSVSWGMNDIASDERIFNLKEIFKFCKNKKSFSDLILTKAAKTGSMAIFKLAMANKFNDWSDIKYLCIASQHNQNEFCKEFIEILKKDEMLANMHSAHISELGRAIHVHDYDFVAAWVTHELAINSGSYQATKRYNMLLVAIDTGDQRMVDLILDIVDLKIQRGAAWTALGTAIKWGFIEIVKLLINKGDDIKNQTSSSIGEPLALAAEYGHYDIAKLLLDSDEELDVDTANFNGETPLIIAAKYGRADIFRLLLDNNANINHITRRGKTALSIARANDFPEIVAIIEKRFIHQTFLGMWSPFVS